MKEFMFYIRNERDAKLSLTHDAHFAFIKQCEVYINQLKSGGNLVAAQPIFREGIELTREAGDWKMNPVDLTGKAQVGYYHVQAKSLDEAVILAKQNPEFEFVPSATIEIHEIKTKETETGFVYPTLG